MGAGGGQVGKGICSGTRDSVADKLDVYFFFLPHFSYCLGGGGNILQALKSL